MLVHKSLLLTSDRANAGIAPGKKIRAAPAIVASAQSNHGTRMGGWWSRRCSICGQRSRSSFAVSHRSDGLLEQIAQLFVVVWIHDLASFMPREESCVRSRRTARKTRTLTNETEIPAAPAIFS